MVKNYHATDSHFSRAVLEVLTFTSAVTLSMVMYDNSSIVSGRGSSPTCIPTAFTVEVFFDVYYQLSA